MDCQSSQVNSNLPILYILITTISMPYPWYISHLQKIFFISPQSRLIFKIACALLHFPHDSSNFTPFFVPLNDLWVPLYTFEKQFLKSLKPLKTLGTVENKRTWAFHSGSNFWRRTRDANPGGCIENTSFQSLRIVLPQILLKFGVWDSNLRGCYTLHIKSNFM